MPAITFTNLFWFLPKNWKPSFFLPAINYCFLEGRTKALENDLVGLKFSKGAIQFSLDNPIPKELIQKIVLFRLEEIETMMQEKWVKSPP